MNVFFLSRGQVLFVKGKRGERLCLSSTDIYSCNVVLNVVIALSDTCNIQIAKQIDMEEYIEDIGWSTDEWLRSSREPFILNTKIILFKFRNI